MKKNSIALLVFNFSLFTAFAQQPTVVKKQTTHAVKKSAVVASHSKKAVAKKDDQPADPLIKRDPPSFMQSMPGPMPYKPFTDCINVTR